MVCTFLPDTKSIPVSKNVVKCINGIDRYEPLRIPSTITKCRAKGHVRSCGKVQSGILHRFISRKQRLKKCCTWGLHPVLHVPPSGHKLHRHVSNRIVWELWLDYGIQDEEELNKENEQFVEDLSQSSPVVVTLGLVKFCSHFSQKSVEMKFLGSISLDNSTLLSMHQSEKTET